MKSPQRTVRLSTPLTEADARSLRIGDHVYLSGPFFTGRSRFYRRAIEDDSPPPIDFEMVNVLMHVGPVMRLSDTGWRPVGLDQTSSLRFEKWNPRAIRRFHLRAIVGKTTMGRDTADAMRQCGCVHLSRIGTPGNLLARSVSEVLAVYNLEEFGPTEATWVMRGENLGPFIVDIDAMGNNLFDHVREAAELRRQMLYARFGIPEDFQYARV